MPVLISGEQCQVVLPDCKLLEVISKLKNLGVAVWNIFLHKKGRVYQTEVHLIQRDVASMSAGGLWQ